MEAFVDRRDQISGPGTHVLAVGVSAYPHLEGGSGSPAPVRFGMTQLFSAATTAAEVAEYFTATARLVVPLATCRLLASPNDDGRESARVPAGAPRATLSGFLQAAAEWREDCASHRDNVAILYLVGHGMSYGHADELFLLEDFGDRIGPMFRNSVSLASIQAGMAPGSRTPDIARTQVVVFDASRTPAPGEFASRAGSATLVFDSEVGAVDDRSALTLFAAAPGLAAYAGRDSSVFGKAFLACLKGKAATAIDDDDLTRWGVTTGSLVRGLQAEAQRLTRRLNVDVTVEAGGAIGDTVLIEFDVPPRVELTIDLSPHDLPSAVVVTMTDTDDAVVLRGPPDADGRLKTTLPAGLYRMTVDPAEGGEGPLVRERWRMLNPPSAVWSGSAVVAR